MAEPIKFPQSNTTHVAEGCNDLPTCVTTDSSGAPVIISVWQLSEEERQRVAATGQVYLYIFGTAQPPVYVGGDHPWGGTDLPLGLVRIHNDLMADYRLWSALKNLLTFVKRMKDDDERSVVFEVGCEHFTGGYGWYDLTINRTLDGAYSIVKAERYK